jgi:hypothetical protein
MNRTSMFITCQNEWDEKTQTLHELDLTEMHHCCVEHCLKPVNFCYNYCKDHQGQKDKYNTPMLQYRCLQTCEDQRNMCLDTCSLINTQYFGADNHYIKCSNESGCDSNDVDCIINNKSSILNCCKEMCPPKDVDCEKNCKYLETFYLNPPPSLIETKNDDNYWNNTRITSVLILSFILIFLFILILKLSKKKLNYS